MRYNARYLTNRHVERSETSQGLTYPHQNPAIHSNKLPVGLVNSTDNSNGRLKSTLLSNGHDCKETSVFTLSNDKIAKGDWKEEGIFYQTETKPIEMTKEQFQLFKNMTDNIKEAGDNVILSKSDIDEAEYLYRNGKFTKDMTSNLPSDYKPSKDAQDLYASDDCLTLSTRIHNHNNTQEMSFGYGTMYNETYDKAMLDSKNGKMKQNYHGDCLQLEYIDKNNKTQQIEY